MSEPLFHVVKDYGETRFYLRREDDLDLGFTHIRALATKFTEDEADAIADRHNQYTLSEAYVIGAGKEAA